MVMLPTTSMRRCGALFAATLSMLMAACSKEPQPVQSVEQEARKEVAGSTKQLSKEQWVEAFRASFEASQTKLGVDGVTTYSACFRKAEGDKCTLSAMGRHDGFQRVDHLIPPGTAWQQSHGDLTRPFMGIYIAVPECGIPSIILAPVLTGGSWLFMDKVAFMADGEVVLERTLGLGEVERDHDERRVVERAEFVATAADAEALGKVASAKKAIIRFSGKKGFVTVDSSTLAVDVGVVFDIVKKLQTAVTACSS